MINKTALLLSISLVVVAIGSSCVRAGFENNDADLDLSATDSMKQRIDARDGTSLADSAGASDAVLGADLQKNYCLRFDTDKDYVRLDAPMSWNADFTASIKIKLLAEAGAFDDFFSCFDPAMPTLSGWQVGFRESGKLRWWVVRNDKDPYPDRCERRSTQALPLNTWYLITFVFDYTSSTSAKYRIYVDDQLWVDLNSPKPTGVNCPKTLLPGALPQTLCRVGGYDGLNMLADDVRVFNRALTQAEVTMLAKGSVPSGVVLYWSMNEGQGAALGDGSGGKHTGTILNPEWIAY